MRFALVALLLAGCSGDPLKDDVEMFCHATDGKSWSSFVDIGPYVAEHAKTDELKQLLLQPVRGQGTIWEFADGIRQLMKKTGVEKCATLDVLLAPRER